MSKLRTLLLLLLTDASRQSSNTCEDGLYNAFVPTPKLEDGAWKPGVQTMEEKIEHGKNGWELVAYSWDDGIGSFRYERRTPDGPPDEPEELVEVRELKRPQPLFA